MINTKLKDISIIFSGLVISRYKIKSKKQATKVITLKSVTQNSINKQYFEKKYIGGINKKYYLQNNDIIIKLTQPYDAVRITPEYAHIIAPSNFAIIRPTTNINTDYLSFYLNSNKIKKQLNRIIVGDNIIKSIHIQDLQNLLIKRKTEKEEEIYGKLFSSLKKRKQIIQKQIETEKDITKYFEKMI